MLIETNHRQTSSPYRETFTLVSDQPGGLTFEVSGTLVLGEPRFPDFTGKVRSAFTSGMSQEYIEVTRRYFGSASSAEEWGRALTQVRENADNILRDLEFRRVGTWQSFPVWYHPSREVRVVARDQRFWSVCGPAAAPAQEGWHGWPQTLEKILALLGMSRKDLDALSSQPRAETPNEESTPFVMSSAALHRCIAIFESGGAPVPWGSDGHKWDGGDPALHGFRALFKSSEYAPHVRPGTWVWGYYHKESEEFALLYGEPHSGTATGVAWYLDVYSVRAAPQDPGAALSTVGCLWDSDVSELKPSVDGWFPGSARDKTLAP